MQNDEVESGGGERKNSIWRGAARNHQDGEESGRQHRTHRSSTYVIPRPVLHIHVHFFTRP